MTPSQLPSANRTSVSRQDDLRLPNQLDWVSAQCYASLEGHDLIRAVRADEECLLLRSVDNGETWATAEVIARNVPVDADRRLLCSVASLYLDPGNGLLVLFLSEIIDPAHEGEFVWADATDMGPRTQRLYYQISRDAGRTWEPRQQIIEKGDEFDERHWARDVWYGRSSLVMEGRRPHRLPDGTIVVPCYLWPTDEHMARIFEAEGRPPELRDDAKYFVQSVCLLARWREDLRGLDWQSGGPVHLPGGYTHAGTCGSDEPTVAFLDDGRWLAVLRTSTSHVQEFRERNVPLVRMCAVSTDAGRTWPETRPLTFDDGAPVYSPSAYSEFIRSSRTGRWYWIGNILEQPTYGGGDPRRPLQIVELDREALCLKRDTVTVIEDKTADDLEWVRFSNFRVYEERDSGDFVLLMTKCYCELQEGWPNLPYPSYRYRIRLTE